MAKPTIASLQTKIALLEEELQYMREHVQSVKAKAVDVPWEQPKVTTPVTRREAMQAAKAAAMASGKACLA